MFLELNIFLSLAIILGFGVLGGFLFDKLKLPKLIFYMFIGILMSPSIFGLIDPTLDLISGTLRQIALVIILTRSGLSLDFKSLREVGRPAILLCFLPATFEIVGVMLLGHLMLDITYLEGLLLGSVLAAVSPAIVVPRMIKLMDEKYGEKKHLPLLVMSGASCDDIYVIILFYVFKGLVSNGKINGLDIFMIPISIILGIILGIVVGIILINLFKLHINDTFKMIIMMAVSFLMIFIENVLKDYVSISSLLGIMVMSMIVLYKSSDSNKLKEGYNRLWILFEILLFALVGAKVDIKMVFSLDGLKCVVVLFGGLLFRSIGVILSIAGCKYSLKEKIFVIISYLPKATVQASIGAIALQEGLGCGALILTCACIAIVISAPLGGLLIDKLSPKLLEKEIKSA